MVRVLFLPHFVKQGKTLQKRYFGFREGLSAILEIFDPTRAVFLGKQLYKIRFSCKGLKKGKSGSFRAIVWYLELKNLLIPVMAYFKGDISHVSKRDIEYHLSIILDELRQSHFF